MSKLTPKNSAHQWFIISAIGFKEKGIAKDLIDKLKTYGYYGPDQDVREIKIFETESVTTAEYDRDNKFVPKNLRDTKNTTWKELPNGRVQKTARRLINRYPSYIFINMRYSPDLWYLVRNTPGVLGVIGSSGKGKAPIPISQEQYEQLTNQKASAPTPVVQSSVNGEIELLEKNHVKILRGQFVDAKGVVKAVDKANKIAKVAIDAFGRDQIIDVDFNDLEKI